MKRDFMFMLRARWAEGKFICVGLDSHHARLPPSCRSVFDFNKAIVEATADLVCAYKPNVAFYPGPAGRQALAESCDHIRRAASKVPIILDAKRGDIGNSNEGYTSEAFEEFDADAVTVSPYLGGEALEPFLRMRDKGIFVLCRTSNPGASEFQDRDVLVDGRPMPLYQHVALRVREWNSNGNCALVVGATAPEPLKIVRGLVGDMPILAPGIGAQAGSLETVLQAGLTPDGDGLIVNASRSVIFASNSGNFAEGAHRELAKLHESVSSFRSTGWPSSREEPSQAQPA